MTPDSVVACEDIKIPGYTACTAVHLISAGQNTEKVIYPH